MTDETEQKFGVRAGLVQPLVPWRFRLVADTLETVTPNTHAVRFDFSKQTITIELRQTVLPQSFSDALHFARMPTFTVETLDGTNDGILFGIKPLGLKLESHNFDLDYSDASGLAMHRYVFSYQSLITGVPRGVEEKPLPADPQFPTPQEALEKLVAKANS